MVWETLPDKKIGQSARYNQLRMAYDSNRLRYYLYPTVGTAIESDYATPATYDANKYRHIITLYKGGELLKSFVSNDIDSVSFDYFGPFELSVQRELINTAPTQPGAFTQPTGELEIGDSKVVSWGASTDAETTGGYLEHILEVRTNGGTWNVLQAGISGGSVLSQYFTIPAVSTVQFRVKARDQGGLESTYRESPTYTVTKPKYYWSKYNVVETTVTNEDAPWESLGNASNTLLSLNKNYKFSGGGWAHMFTDKFVNGESVSVGTKGYSVDNSDLYEYTVLVAGQAGNSISVAIRVRYKAKNTKTTTASKDSLVQSGIIAVEGTYPWDGKHTDNYWYVRGSRVNQSIAPTGAFTAPTSGTKFKPNQTVSVTFTASTASNLSLYEVDYRYKNGVWTTLGNTNALSRTFTTTTDKTLTDVQFRVRAKNTSNVYSDYVYSEIFPIEHNVAPLLTLNTENNRTLYENDTFIIEGSAIDNDDNQTLTIYYQIDGLPAKVITPGLSKTTIPFNKQLVFKSGKLFEGETAITEALADGQAHTLKVWATDNENSSSVIAERSFHVVPNRAPVLAVNPINQASGMINSDEMTISGTASDPDGNSFVVSYKINGGLNTEIYRGKDSEWSFQLNVKSLKDGENKIVIEVVDTYNSKFSKTITLNKSFITTPIQKSTAFYEITLPKGSATGVLLWIQRENGLGLTAEISMTLAGEQEKFVPMTLETSEMLTDYIMEDEFIYEATAAKDKAILKLNLSRESLDTSFGVTLLSGVLS